MNVNLDIVYLTGGDDSFGPDFGAATVKTITSKGYAERCGNIGKLYNNLRFTVDMESSIMNSLDKKEPALSAAKKWLADHPETLDSWLDGVTTIDGKDGKSITFSNFCGGKFPICIISLGKPSSTPAGYYLSTAKKCQAASRNIASGL